MKEVDYMRKLSKYVLVKRKRIPYKKMFKMKIRKTTCFCIKPKNSFAYDGIEVNELLILKKKFIANLLKKKIKRKLDIYLDLILDDSDSDSDQSAYKEHLDNVSRFKDIIKFKYKKYLDKKYTNLMDEYLDYEKEEKEYIDPVVYDYYNNQKRFDEELELEEEMTRSSRRR